MGALCGKESHFEQLGGQGHALGQPSAKPPPRSKSSGVVEQPSPRTLSQTLGSSPLPLPAALDSTQDQEGARRREAMLRAAEERSRTANSRGTSGGKLATQLAAQRADGNRAVDARHAGGTRDLPLVWD
ncbi:hypothetical protein MVLG_06785 [Microbotryum lychnidis-dioicae p1A1 Lamole]|uniref:Uncharacterized protein n=1 Tax=Microbotryum lychnidis-dioicae (strain p1A1 Lamole / MvSl-1064) TaxID=683840 RepID=U5HIC3_USTV1|nr:hypothetical protein MVLG_06785 [Microbotryum lychnidis-dioicae p1A1 Lamole]|eukprot:KDE02679.1 hypothetical protein MVLG_06785 [Microbotryum lychnidis-dioicae p1A1 Lamole]